LPDNKEDRKQVLKDFKASLDSDDYYKQVREEVREFCRQFKIPGVKTY